MQTKYRFELDGEDHIAIYDTDGRTGTLNVWKSDELVRHLGFLNDLPDTDADFRRILREEMGDPYLDLERWVDLEVQLDLTTTVTVNVSAFEGDNMDEVFYDLLRTSFKDRVMALFHAELGKDPYIEVGYVEEGPGGHRVTDEEARNYMREVE